MTHRHRSGRPRRAQVLTAGAAVAGVGLLIAGAVTAGDTVPGHPVAQTHSASTGDGHDYPRAVREAVTKKAKPTKRATATAKPTTAAPKPSTAKPAPAPATGGAPAPVAAPEGQRPGTIRLPQGGTARLVRAEVGSDRTLPIPNGVDEATWWGAGLGARGGATLFSGHVNWQGRTGPFNELWSDNTGQIVSVQDASGKTWRYRISKIITLHKNDLPAQAEELFGPTGPARVVLVTCGGRWAGGDEGYDSNRIVVANPV